MRQVAEDLGSARLYFWLQAGGLLDATMLEFAKRFTRWDLLKSKNIGRKTVAMVEAAFAEERVPWHARRWPFSGHAS